MVSIVGEFWWDRNEIQPLVDGMDTWKKYIEVIGTAKGDRFCMVEFVRNDDPDQFLKDAVALKKILL